MVVIMNQTEKMKKQCPICYSEELTSCVDIKDVPIYCNVLLDTQEKALSVNRGHIKLVFCNDCGHLFNAAFDPQKIDYNADYENSLHYSQQFQDYAKSLAGQLVENYNLHGKTVVEIACGKGDFLALLCKSGVKHGIGFDPSYEPERLDEHTSIQLTFIKDYYSDKYLDYKADLVCCRHALEHIEWPLDFLNMLRKAVIVNDAAVFFEVPNAMYTIKDMGIWDIIYEHCSYFCDSSLKKAFLMSGFSVSRIGSAFGDQFLCIEASPSKKGQQEKDNTPSDLSDTLNNVKAFSKKYNEKVNGWKKRLADFAHRGDRTVIWGAGSKGVTFLNTLEIRDEVECVVDINPHKWNRFVPGSGHKVVAPASLKRSKLDNIIVMNPMYLEEVCSIVKSMGVSASVMKE